MAGKPLTNPRLTDKDIVRYIASNTSLTQAQVRECFKAYREMIENIYSDPNVDCETEIPLPNMGKFYLGLQRGRKEGVVYKLPRPEGDRIIVSKGEPSFYKFKFRVSKTLNEILKEATKFVEKD